MSGGPCEGDLDGDGDVDFVDLGILLNRFGTPPNGNPADLDGDGDIDFVDLGILLNGFGPC